MISGYHEYQTVVVITDSINERLMDRLINWNESVYIYNLIL